MKVSAKGSSAVEFIGEVEKLWRFHHVDLVEHKNFCGAALRQAAQDRLDFGVYAFVCINEQGGRFGVARTAPGGRHHGAVKPAFGREDSWRIDKDDLRRAFQGDTANRATRRLHLAGDDRDFRADQLVDECRFSSIRRPDKGNKTAAGSVLFVIHAAPFWPVC